MKQVQESLFEYNTKIFFTQLNEEAEEIEGMSPADKEKKKKELEKLGTKVLLKCIKNYKEFRAYAGSMWQEYRDFWETQKAADESVEQKGLFYNLWKSDYIVGVVKEPAGHAALKVFDTSADSDDYVVFETKNPETIKVFKEWYDLDLKGSIKEIIQKQKDAMKTKKEAEAKQAKEEAAADKKAKIDKFLGESEKKTLNEEFTKAHDFGVVQTGGSIGETNKYYIPGKGKLIGTFKTNEEAKAYAAKRRKGLTAGEKGHYKIKFGTIKLTDKIKDSLY